jgi:hypothetical protein
MTQWCLSNLKDKYEMLVVFANTGEENEETLEFVKKCDEILDFNTTWVEAKVHHGERRGTSHNIVDFESASRNGEPFEEVIKKYIMPSPSAPLCTRELKTSPITSFVKKEAGWNKFYTAIGIRVDEFDRMSVHKEKLRYIYPLCELNPKTKPEINAYWNDMPFRLELKGYEGNCKVCYKKSLRKLITIAKYNPEKFDVFKKFEEKYDHFAPESKPQLEERFPLRFYRNYLSVDDILEMAKKPFIEAKDDSEQIDFQQRLFDNEFDIDLDQGSGCEETCEPFENKVQ